MLLNGKSATGEQHDAGGCDLGMASIYQRLSRRLVHAVDNSQ